MQGAGEIGIGIKRPRIYTGSGRKIVFLVTRLLCTRADCSAALARFVRGRKREERVEGCNWIECARLDKWLSVNVAKFLNILVFWEWLKFDLSPSEWILLYNVKLGSEIYNRYWYMLIFTYIYVIENIYFNLCKYLELR